MSLKSSFRLQGEEAKQGGSADLAQPADSRPHTLPAAAGTGPLVGAVVSVGPD